MNTYYVTLLEAERVTVRVEAESEADAVRAAKADITLYDEIDREWWGLTGSPDVELVEDDEAAT